MAGRKQPLCACEPCNPETKSGGTPASSWCEDERGRTANGGASLIYAKATAASNTTVTQVFIIPGQVPAASWTSPPHCQHWASELGDSHHGRQGSAMRNMEFVRCDRAGELGRSQTPLSPSGQKHSVISGTKPRTQVRGRHSGLGSEATAGPVQTEGRRERPDQAPNGQHSVVKPAKSHGAMWGSCFCPCDGITAFSQARGLISEVLVLGGLADPGLTIHFKGASQFGDQTGECC